MYSVLVDRKYIIIILLNSYNTIIFKQISLLLKKIVYCKYNKFVVLKNVCLIF